MSARRLAVALAPLKPVANRAGFLTLLAQRLRNSSGRPFLVVAIQPRTSDPALTDLFASWILPQLEARLPGAAAGLLDCGRLALLVEDCGQPWDLASCIQQCCFDPGLAVYPCVGFVRAIPGVTPAEEVLGCAELAAWQCGRERFRAAGESLPDCRDTSVCALDEVIRRAIRGGELALAYQPVVDLISGSIVGFECLLRWNHPRLGMLPAREFIADFERSAAMAEVDCWVVAEALGQASAWAAAVGNPVRVFVNICPSTLEDWASVGKILEVLRTAALPAGCLDLEITERVAPGRRQHFLESCWLLKEQGIGFTLDDFGTGHSGLELLAELPAGFVKLDRRLAAGLGEPSRVAGWVGSTLVELATALDAATIAEGMEEPEQLEAARRAGCYAGQGYLLGAPLPADTASDLLAAA